MRTLLSAGAANAKLHGLALTALLLTTSMTSTASAAGAPFNSTKFYVSKAGDNSDGLTWQTAWTAPDKIKWRNVTPQSQVIIACDDYNCGLIVPPGVGLMDAPVMIKPGSPTGQVRLLAASGPGVYVSSGSSVYLFGFQNESDYGGWSIRKSQFEISKANGAGVLVAPGAKKVWLVGLTVDNCRDTGIEVRGGSEVIVSTCNVFDNRGGSQVNLQSTAGSFDTAGAAIDGCWIHCTRPGIGRINANNELMKAGSYSLKGGQNGCRIVQ